MVNFSGFGDEAIAAFIVFILGVIFTIIWQKYTTKNCRIAYRVYISRPKIDIGEEISNRLSLSFDQQPVDTLHLYRITIENVGNLAVRNQHLLIKFDQDTVPISPAQFQHEPLVGLLIRSVKNLILTALVIILTCWQKAKKLSSDFSQKTIGRQR